ncbi:MAG: hypothetical protein ROO76_09545 [Terriglobia bacterium]|nr:hypothetical protein [Terriglobia bacterium]
MSRRVDIQFAGLFGLGQREQEAIARASVSSFDLNLELVPALFRTFVYVEADHVVVARIVESFLEAIGKVRAVVAGFSAGGFLLVLLGFDRLGLANAEDRQFVGLGSVPRWCRFADYLAHLQ